MTSKETRKEMDKLKKSGIAYNWVGGKKKDHELHHKKQVSEGGKNTKENIIQLYFFWHRWFHKQKNRGEINEPKWGNAKSPSIKKTIEILGEASLENHVQKMAMEDVKNDLKSR